MTRRPECLKMALRCLRKILNYLDKAVDNHEHPIEPMIITNSDLLWRVTLTIASAMTTAGQPANKQPMALPPPDTPQQSQADSLRQQILDCLSDDPICTKKLAVKLGRANDSYLREKLRELRSERLIILLPDGLILWPECEC